MAAGGAVCHYAADSPHENEEMSREEAGSLHERLVAYVHTLAHGSRRGVWSEHSYARSRIGAGSARAGAGRVRVLLAPPPPPPRVADVPLDVDAEPDAPPSPPVPPGDAAPHHDDDDDEDDDDDDDADWETTVAALAPTPAHSRLVRAAADALRAARLERLADGAAARRERRERARATARRLRRALAPLWRGGAPRWLHSTLAAHLPRGTRRAYEDAVGEMRRAVPRLAERLTGAWAPPPPEPSVAAGAVGPESSPWLVWVSSGVAALDARWERRLAALVHTRVLRGVGGARGAEAAAPEPWCGAAAGAVRASLTDALAEAGSRSVILGGLGAGAAAALLLARGAGGAGGAAGGVRGCVLAAPPLLTAEGGRDARDDALHAARLPLLLVVGSAAADAARAVPNNVCESGSARRLLEVRGADSELRLPRRLRRRKGLPQHALDAALVEECVRWAVETAEQEEPGSPPAPAPAPERRRPALPNVVREIDLCVDEEYSHLPAGSAAASAPPPPAASPSQNSRALEIVEGRMVSRGSGGTPLALLPPRRTALAAADIMRLPIVFADDAAAEPGGAGSPVTVTSGKPTVAADRRGAVQRASAESGAGSVKFTRVILAKRGGGAAAGAGARRLLLRRGVRLVPRPREADA